MMIRLKPGRPMTVKIRRMLWPRVKDILCPFTLKALAWGYAIRIQDTRRNALVVELEKHGLYLEV